MGEIWDWWRQPKIFFLNDWRLYWGRRGRNIQYIKWIWIFYSPHPDQTSLMHQAMFPDYLTFDGIFWQFYSSASYSFASNYTDSAIFLLIQSRYALMRVKPLGNPSPQPYPHETTPTNLFSATKAPPESPSQILWPIFPVFAHTIVSKSYTGSFWGRSAKLSTALRIGQGAHANVFQTGDIILGSVKHAKTFISISKGMKCSRASDLRLFCPSMKRLQEHRPKWS